MVYYWIQPDESLKAVLQASNLTRLPKNCQRYPIDVFLPAINGWLITGQPPSYFESLVAANNLSSRTRSRPLHGWMSSSSTLFHSNPSSCSGAGGSLFQTDRGCRAKTSICSPRRWLVNECHYENQLIIILSFSFIMRYFVAETAVERTFVIKESLL